MAELNWIDKNKRLPTEEDGDFRTEKVYALSAGIACCVHYSEVTSPAYSHWLPFAEMPVPKRWRVPTIQDLAKAGKPIPCRVRDSTEGKWIKGSLAAMAVDEKPHAFYACSDWWKYCEISDA